MPAVTVKFVIGVAVGICFIIGVGIFGGSFKRTSEGKACIITNSYTGETQDAPTTGASIKLLSPWHDIHCYPTTVQRMVFCSSCEESSGLERTITARTMEGLTVSLDLEVDYRIEAESIVEVFTRYDTDAVDAYLRIGRSELRNAAAEFSGLEYLSGGRVAIGNRMKELLSQRLLELDEKVAILRVNLLTVGVPEAFETAFRRVEELQLDTQEELENRVIALRNAERANQTLYNSLIAEQQKTLVEAEASLGRTILENRTRFVETTTSAERQRTQQETLRVTTLIEAQAKVEEAVAERAVAVATVTQVAKEARLREDRLRSVALVDAAALVEKTRADQAAVLATAQTELERVTLEQETRLLLARAEQSRALLAANATATTTLLSGLADADKLKKELEGQHELLESLPATAKFTRDQSLQYLWARALTDIAPDSQLFMDYTKQPMFLEGLQGDAIISATGSVDV